MPVRLTDTPRQRVAAAAEEYGDLVVVGWCTDLVAASDPARVTGEAALVLGGRHAQALLADPTADHAWWWRVWGLRGLLHVWDDRASGTVMGALDDEVWRVREGALRVVARRRLDDDLQRISDLREDPVERVRSAAARALVALERQPATAGSRDSSSQPRTGQSSPAAADSGSPSKART